MLSLNELIRLIERGMPNGRRHHYPWRVMSISRSKVSPSVYAYVIRKQNLVVIRLSNHNTAERGQENIIDIHTPKVSEPAYIVGTLRKITVSGQFKSQEMDQDFFLMMQMIAAVYRTQTTIFYWDGQLTINNPKNPKRVITEKQIYEVTEKLMRMHLLKTDEQGIIAVTHNGLDLLAKYHKIKKAEWPTMLNSFSLDNILNVFKKKYGHEIYKVNELVQVQMKENSVGMQVLGENSKLQVLAAKMGIVQQPAPSAKEDEKPKHETPKMWKAKVLTTGEEQFAYPYKLVHYISPERRRSIYFYLVNERTGRLLPLRIGITEHERTPLSKVIEPMNNIHVGTSQEAITFLKTYEPNELHQAKLHYLHYVWMKIVDWGSHHGSFVVSDGEAVVIYHYLKQDVLVMHVFPRSHKRWLESLNKWGLMYIQRGKYHLTEAGKAVLKAYKKTAEHQPKIWDTNLLQFGIEKLMMELITN